MKPHDTGHYVSLDFLTRKTCFLLLLILLNPGDSEAQKKLHKIKFKSVSQAHRFLKYSENQFPIIAGHRGTIEDGFPENSIESMEHTLKYTPAIFEIDPRLTRDSIIVLMHDATLDRTTTGTGNITDHTYAELQKLNLKDRNGNPTPYRIPSLEAVLEWARGKTIVNLDHKGVPFAMVADLIIKHNAAPYVMITTHSAEQAAYYLSRNPDQLFSAHIRSVAQFEEYKKAGIPFTQMIAYIGPHIRPENQKLYRLLNQAGARAMISSASTYDKLKDKAERGKKYLEIIRDGAGVLESDYPIEVSEALKSLRKIRSRRKN